MFGDNLARHLFVRDTVKFQIDNQRPPDLQRGFGIGAQPAD